jgi:peptidoglycan-associated lipoprotein
MQKGPSQVSSGAIAPTVIGPDKDLKEVYILSGLVLVLAGAFGAFWYYSGQEQSYVSKTPTETLTGAQVTNVLKTSTTPIVETVANNRIAPAQTSQSDSIHTDIYFEVGRKGLTDDAKAILATQADLAKNDPDLGILVQGYTDQQGSTGYNKKLGLLRGEKVKEYLVSLGVSDHAIKVVSLGEEGVLCLDNSDVCRQMNRRVHLEFRKIGKEHMVTPAITETTVVGPPESGIDSSAKAEETDSLMESLPPSPSDPAGLTLEPSPGS